MSGQAMMVKALLDAFGVDANAIQNGVTEVVNLARNLDSRLTHIENQLNELIVLQGNIDSRLAEMESDTHAAGIGPNGSAGIPDVTLTNGN